MYIYTHTYIHICITFSSNSEYSGLPKAKKNSKFPISIDEKIHQRAIRTSIQRYRSLCPRVRLQSPYSADLIGHVRAFWASSCNSRMYLYSFMKTKAKRKEKRKQVSRNDRFGRLLIKRLKFVTDVSTRHSMDALVPISLRIPIETQPPSTLWTTRDDPTEPVQSDRYANAEKTVRRNQRWIHATVLPRQNQQASTTTQLNNK